MKNLMFLTLVAAATVSLGGCSIDYRETLKLQDEGLWQQVQVSGSQFDSKPTTDTPASAEFAPGKKRMGSLFEPEQDSMPVSVPATLGTHPSWQHLRSPLGEARVLVEARGGAVPVAQDVDELIELVDVLCEEAATFVKANTVGKPWSGRLEAMLRGDVKRDLRDACMIVWGCAYAYSFLETDGLKSHRAGDSQLAEALAKVEVEVQRRLWTALAAFLVERNWLSPEAGAIMAVDGPRIEVSPGSGISATGGAVAASLVSHVRSRLGGLSEEAFYAIGLDFPEAALEQFGDHLNATVHAHLAGKPYIRAAAEPLTELLTSRDLETTLEVGDHGKPTVSNGQWNPNQRVVEWSLDASPFAPGLSRAPILWTAVWVKPFTAEQSRKLGSVALEGTDLLAFIAAWHAASTDTQSEVLRRLDNGEFKDHNNVADAMVEALIAIPNPALYLP